MYNKLAPINVAATLSNIRFIILKSLYENKLQMWNVVLLYEFVNCETPFLILPTCNTFFFFFCTT